MVDTRAVLPDMDGGLDRPSWDDAAPEGLFCARRPCTGWTSGCAVPDFGSLGLRWARRALYWSGLLDAMPGASEQTRRVKILNASWLPGEAGEDGRFEILIVTDDDQRHTMPASAGSMTAVVARGPDAVDCPR